LFETYNQIKVISHVNWGLQLHDKQQCHLLEAIVKGVVKTLTNQALLKIYFNPD
jgi:hypothetical protein